MSRVAAADKTPTAAARPSRFDLKSSQLQMKCRLICRATSPNMRACRQIKMVSMPTKQLVDSECLLQ